MISAYLCWPACVSFCFARKAVGASCTPVFPAPSTSGGTRICKTRQGHAAGTDGHAPCRRAAPFAKTPTLPARMRRRFLDGKAHNPVNQRKRRAKPMHAKISAPHQRALLKPDTSTRLWSARALAASMLHRLRGLGLSARGMRPVATSAAPGTGTAIPARAATSPASVFVFLHRRNHQEWTWSEDVPRSRRSRPTPIPWPTLGCAPDIVFNTHVPRALRRTAQTRQIECNRSDEVSAKLCSGGRLPVGAERPISGHGGFRGPCLPHRRWPQRPSISPASGWA